MSTIVRKSRAQVAIEAGRQFDECYGLAFAQQLKNKDIPEGGSKAVLLVDTTHSAVSAVGGTWWAVSDDMPPEDSASGRAGAKD